MQNKAALLALVVVLAGCSGGGDGGGGNETAGDGPEGTMEPETIIPGLQITEYTSAADTGSPIEITWFVDPRSSDPDATFTIDETAIHYGPDAVDAPSGPGDYPNEVGKMTAPEIPDEFTTSFTVNDPATLFVRARARVDGVDHWSIQQIIVVAAGATGVVHNVTIGAPGVGPFSMYDQNPLEVSVGDAVVWTNADTFGLEHTATDTGGMFDTGAIAAAASSQAFFFFEAGNYTYGCTVHPESMNGAQIMVTA